MLMADTMAIFFVILGLMLALPAMWLLCLGLWPNTVTDSAASCSRGLVRPFLAGLPLTGLTAFAAAVFNAIPGAPGNLLAIATVCFYLLFSQTGMAGLAKCIGQRLASPGDSDRLWKPTLRGSVVLELPFLLPFLGWFVILPASIITGCGAVTITLVRRVFASSPRSLRPHVTETSARVEAFNSADTLGASQ